MMSQNSGEWFADVIGLVEVREGNARVRDGQMVERSNSMHRIGNMMPKMSIGLY